jgi:hypothetical protein
MNTGAFLDALYIVEKLSMKYEDVAESEVHLFSYLACLLALYNGESAYFWDYIFITGKTSSPFAKELNESMEMLFDSGLVNASYVESETFFKITQNGIDELSSLSQFGLYEDRLKYLKSSCETLLLVPLSDVRAAIRKEPSVVYSNTWSRNEALVTEGSASIEILYDQFDSLKIALQGKYTDMLIPAVTWLKFIQEK